MWADARTALGTLGAIPRTAMSFAMAKHSEHAPVGAKAAFEVGMKFEGRTLKEFTIEALTKYELPEGAKNALGKAGVELGGKQSTTVVAHKND